LTADDPLTEDDPLIADDPFSEAIDRDVHLLGKFISTFRQWGNNKMCTAGDTARFLGM